jgi:inositol phosphorylceramide mannosyltransferase catalytic subunit
VYLWDDNDSSEFVEESFPQLKGMWDNYRYPVQRVDALRYMLLYKFGGEVS